MPRPRPRLVSIVIPTFKEDGIASILDELSAHVARIDDHDFELLLVDDSPPEYQEAIRAWARDHASLAPKVRVVLVPGEHRGKGHAVKLGALASKGEVVFTMDADLPVTLDHVDQFLGYFGEGGEGREGFDAVVAERPLTRNKSQPVRFVASRVLFAMQRYFVFQSDAFEDTQCGFKAFRGEAIRSLAARQIVDGGMYDIEYLYIATRDAMKVARVPVVQRPEVRPSKINAWKCLMTDPRDLARVKLRAVTGGYRRGR